VKKMSKNQSFLIVFFATILFSLNSKYYPQPSSNSNNSPNFIFILVDDQGWNGTSVQMMNTEPLSKSDYHSTPNLEKLASRGIRFSNAYASAPVCAPSRYSIQFGKTPARMSFIRVGMSTSHINHKELVSIPKALKKINKEYVAAHFGKWGIGSIPETLGYDYSDGPTKNKDGGFVNDRTQWNHVSVEDPKNIFSITQKAVDFMEKNTIEKKPFYLQISHYAVHASIQSKKETFLNQAKKPLGAQHINPGFAAMTEDLDKGLGIILDKISQLGIQDNTYVIYMSDNGSVPNIPGAKKYTKSYNYPLKRGKWDALEGGLRVPLVIAGPGIEFGNESQVPVSGSDILPTIKDLAGKSNFKLNEIDGGSFKSILLDPSKLKVKREVDGIFFHVPYKNGIALKRPHSAVRKGDFKLVKFQDNGELFLYNLTIDKKESQNLVYHNPKKAKELEKLLMNYLKEVHAPKWQEGITWKGLPLSEINSNY
jgi:arylsulfatase A-like enzyme